MLDPSQIEATLTRLGLSAPPSTCYTGLAELYGAWCRHVPFDNVRKLIAVRSGSTAPLPGDDPAEFFDAWLEHGVGGTCWAGNGALCALLETLGFDARRGVATMMVAPNLPPNHGTVVVSLPDGPYLVDASILHVEPLSIVEGREATVTHPAWGVTGHWLDDKYAVRWRGLTVAEPFDCRIDYWPVSAERFRTQHEATRTWSPFNFELMFTLVRGDGRIGVAHGQAVRIAADGTITAEPMADRMRYLVDELGISETLAREIPADLSTPPPPGSRAAAEQLT
jgi:N-hydroxyarylamine O-acetyltransferase